MILSFSLALDNRRSLDVGTVIRCVIICSVLRFDWRVTANGAESSSYGCSFIHIRLRVVSLSIYCSFGKYIFSSIARIIQFRFTAIFGLCCQLYVLLFKINQHKVNTFSFITEIKLLLFYFLFFVLSCNHIVDIDTLHQPEPILEHMFPDHIYYIKLYEFCYKISVINLLSIDFIQRLFRRGYVIIMFIIFDNHVSKINFCNRFYFYDPSLNSH